MLDAPRFPEDLAACHALLAQQEEALQIQATTLQSQAVELQTRDLTITGLSEQLAAQQREIETQKLTINELMRRAFLKRRERYLENPGQLRIDFGDTPEAADAAEGLTAAIDESRKAAEEIVVPEHTRRRHVPRQPRNEQLPPHLPRYEVTAPGSDEAKTCPTHGEKKLIGHDRQETLEFLPPKLQVRVTLIPKYACESSPACGVSEASRPEGLVEGNKYDTTVATQIITAKYGYHLPIYRQQDVFGSCGWTPSRGTLLNITTAAGDLLPPFMDYLRGEVRRDFALGTDETRVTLLLPPGGFIPPAGDSPKSRRIHEVFSEARAGNQPSVTARMWAYRGVIVPLNVFDFTVSRHRDGPDDFLVDSQYTGLLLADCYSGYQGISLRSDARIVRAACNAHARRKFFEARDNHPVLANQFLALYQQLYDVEDRARSLSAEDRQSLRAAESEPLWTRMRELLDGEVASRVLPKEKIREAMNYLSNHWTELRRYLSDGRLPCDNNLVEQLMKQVALGRKNWLFLGSVAAGERAANFLTLISSALRNDLDPFPYVKDVLDSLLAGSTDYQSLRPDVWAQSHPDAIRVYRQVERRDRSFRQSARREFRRR